jgi:hypothetical protein
MKSGFIVLAFLFLVGVIGATSNLGSMFKEGYKNGSNKANLQYSNVVNGESENNQFSTLLGPDSYPGTGSKVVTDNEYSDIWWQFPIFKVGSYAQITNNLRYRRNPDDGECRTAEFCGAMYRDNQQASNFIHPLPPVANEPGVRINYYRTQANTLIGAQPGQTLELPAF